MDLKQDIQTDDSGKLSRDVSAAIEERIKRNFTYHAPKGNQVERYEHLRDSAKGFANVIAIETPPSREQSLALTNLEQAVMWANAAIARNE